jgi:hypothetical protein
MIAALFVARDGAYFGLPHVDPWDEVRDARLYRGPHPVVAHPPCARWCRLAGLVEARYGYRRGDDGGCFASALTSVQRFGGILEHPAWSMAWSAFELPIPPRSGGWIRGIDGGWICHVEQGRYGHPAKKATWLYAFGIDDPPSMRWGLTPDSDSRAIVSWCGNKVRRLPGRPRLRSKEASSTPTEFRDALIAIADKCNRLTATQARP